jgi:choline kinase
MIRNCNSCGISEFVLVLGYLDNRIRDFVATQFPKIDVTYVVNEKYNETNTGFSLMLAAEATRGTGFIKFDADVVFDTKILHRLIRSPFETTICIDRGIQLDAEEVKVIVDNQFRVLRASKDVEPKEAWGESIGIEKINADTAKHLFIELAQMMTQADHHQAYYEVAYERLMAKGFTFQALDITGLNWTEIDTHNDFVSANKMFAITPRANATFCFR